jgi:uncharacterized membrane protein
MRARWAVLLTLLLAAVPAAGRTAPAAGNLQFCNHYPHTVFIALAWKANGVVYSRGWWSDGTGRCIRITLDANAFYWRGETDDYTLPNGEKASTSWGDGGRGYCVASKGFFYNKASGACGTASRKGFLASWTRTDGIPIYQTVTIKSNGSSEQSIEAGHEQSLQPPAK